MSIVNQVSGWFEEWSPIQHVDGPGGAWLVRRQWPEILVQDPTTGLIVHRVPLDTVHTAKTGTIWNKGAVAITAAGDVVCATHADRLGAYDLVAKQWRWWVPFESEAKYIIATRFHCAVAVRDKEQTHLRRFDIADGRSAGETDAPGPDHYVDSIVYSDGDMFLAGARTRRSQKADAPWKWYLGSIGELTFSAAFEAVCVGIDRDDAGAVVWSPPRAYDKKRIQSTAQRLGAPMTVDPLACPAVPSAVDGATVVAVGSAGRYWITSKHRNDGAGLVSHVRDGDEIVLSRSPRQRGGWAEISPSGWLLAGVSGGALVLWSLDGNEEPRPIADVSGLDVRGRPVFGYDDRWVGVVDATGALHQWSTGWGGVLPVVQLPDAAGVTENTRWRVFAGPRGLFASRRVDVRLTQEYWVEKPRDLYVNSVDAPLEFAKFVAPANTVKHAAHAMSDGYAIAARPDAEHAAWALLSSQIFLVMVDYKDGVRVFDVANRKQTGRYTGTAWPGPGHRGLSISPDGNAAAVALDGYVRGYGRKKQGVLILDLPTAKLRAFAPFEYLFKYVEDTRWLDSDRTVVAWDATRHLGGDLFMRVGVMEGEREPRAIYTGSGQGSVALGRDAHAVYQHLDTGEVRVYRLDGTDVITYALVDGGAFAYTPDGRRFCSQAGCEYFSCRLDDQIQDVSSCEAGMGATFRLSAELAADSVHAPWRAK